MTPGLTLAEAGTKLASLGLSPGSSGNLSVRSDAGLRMTPTGASLDALHGIELTELDADGRWLRGGTPSKEVPLHLGFYRRDAAFRAVVHLHSPYATTLSCLPPWSERSAVAPISPYFVMRVGQTPLLPYRAPGHAGLGADVEGVPFAIRAVLLQNHGQVVAAPTLDGALELAIELEEACRLQLSLAGLRPHLLGPDEIAELTERSGAPWGHGDRAHP